ncbi:MAG: hypothetical protein Kow0065_12510 [Methylomicrobium sp.]
MRSNRRVVRAFAGLVLPLLAGAGCSTIKSWFPDKEKDYQFRTEIPELILPKEMEVRQKAERPSRLPKIDLRRVDMPETARDEDKITQIERLNDGSATMLRVNESMSRTWRIVGKALARNSIEIVARDRALGLYTVQYDPNAQKVTDESLWDEVLFIFGQVGSNEKEYRVRLIEREGFTDVTVRDETNQIVTSGDGLILLETLQRTIVADLADQ